MTRDEREQRAEALLPLLEAAVKDEESRRQVARDIGVSHTGLKRIIARKVVPQPETISKMEAWAKRGGGPATYSANGREDSAALDDRVDEVLGAEASPLEKSELAVDLALMLRCAALRDRNRTARLEAQVALIEARTGERRQRNVASRRAKADEEARLAQEAANQTAKRPKGTDTDADSAGGG